MSQQTKLDALNESLKSADDQIAHQKRLNTQLELENKKLNAFTQKLLCKIKMSQLEMTDLREQCNEITKEASATKNITAKVSNFLNSNIQNENIIFFIELNIFFETGIER